MGRGGKTCVSSALAAAIVLWAIASPAGILGDRMGASPDGPESIRVHASVEEALDRVFAGADSVWTEAWAPGPAERLEVETRLGRRVAEPRFVFHRARGDGVDLGVALVLEEKGRFKPITFMVHVSADGSVASVVVLVYRESRGDGVCRPRFLKQFRGKSIRSALRLDRDVTAVSGATISSRALTAGVRRALVLMDVRDGAAVR